MIVSFSTTSCFWPGVGAAVLEAEVAGLREGGAENESEEDEEEEVEAFDSSNTKTVSSATTRGICWIGAVQTGRASLKGKEGTRVGQPSARMREKI